MVCIKYLGCGFFRFDEMSALLECRFTLSNSSAVASSGNDRRLHVILTCGMRTEFFFFFWSVVEIIFVKNYLRLCCRFFSCVH